MLSQQTCKTLIICQTPELNHTYPTPCILKMITHTHRSKHAIHLPLPFSVADLAQGQCYHGWLQQCVCVLCRHLAVHVTSAVINLYIMASFGSNYQPAFLKCAESVKNTKQPDNITSLLHHHCSPQKDTSEPCLNHENHVTI